MRFLCLIDCNPKNIEEAFRKVGEEIQRDINIANTPEDANCIGQTFIENNQLVNYEYDVVKERYIGEIFDSIKIGAY